VSTVAVDNIGLLVTNDPALWMITLSWTTLSLCGDRFRAWLITDTPRAFQASTLSWTFARSEDEMVIPAP